MTRLRRIPLGLAAILLVGFGGFAVAQEETPTAIVEYFDDDTELTISDADGFEYQSVYLGMELRAGDTVVTRATTVELSLRPNGSIMKIAPNTDFTIEAIQGADGATENRVAVLGGRVRTVAARVAGGDAQFRVRTRTAVGGVRGTDFAVTVVPDSQDLLEVLEGAVEFTNTATGQALLVGAGQIADTFAAAFEVVEVGIDAIRESFSSLDFERLDPSAVPGRAPEPEEAAAEEAEATDDAVAEEPADTATGGSAAVPAVPSPPEEPADAEATEAGDLAEGLMGEATGPLGSLMGRLQEILGMELGSVTIGDETYAKAVLQPQFEFGRFRGALYLPIIYSNNLFDPDDWYKPDGNSEWSFGTDDAFAGQDNEVILRIGDIARDTFLKIRYLQFGELRDPFFFKFGSIPNITLGHGAIVRRYANDTDFPAVRRLGLNIGIDFGAVGFEALGADLANPEIFGGRFYFRPFGPVAIGLSGVTDLGPASELPDLDDATQAAAVRAADPVFLNVGLDLDIPIVEGDLLSFVLFADGAGMMPYIRNAYTFGTSSVEAGLRYDAVIQGVGGSTEPFGVENYGIMAGVFGNIAIVDYRLEYRRFNGFFRPAFYDETYDRTRGDRAIEVMNFLADPSAYTGVTQGIYGYAGADLFNILTLNGGYFWPWRTVGDAIEIDPTKDYLEFKLAVAEDSLPLGLYGGITYSRTGFANAIMNESVSLFDANTAVRGEIVYPFASFLDIALAVTTNVVRDETTGDIVYDENGNPRIAPSISIETRFGGGIGSLGTE